MNLEVPPIHTNEPGNSKCLCKMSDSSFCYCGTSINTIMLVYGAWLVGLSGKWLTSYAQLVDPTQMTAPVGFGLSMTVTVWTLLTGLSYLRVGCCCRSSAKNQRAGVQAAGLFSSCAAILYALQLGYFIYLYFDPSTHNAWVRDQHEMMEVFHKKDTESDVRLGREMIWASTGTIFFFCATHDFQKIVDKLQNRRTTKYSG